MWAGVPTATSQLHTPVARPRRAHLLQRRAHMQQFRGSPPTACSGHVTHHRLLVEPLVSMLTTPASRGRPPSTWGATAGSGYLWPQATASRSPWAASPPSAVVVTTRVCYLSVLTGLSRQTAVHSGCAGIRSQFGDHASYQVCLRLRLSKPPGLGSNRCK